MPRSARQVCDLRAKRRDLDHDLDRPALSWRVRRTVGDVAHIAEVTDEGDLFTVPFDEYEIGGKCARRGPEHGDNGRAVDPTGLRAEIYLGSELGVGSRRCPNEPAGMPTAISGKSMCGASKIVAGAAFPPRTALALHDGAVCIAWSEPGERDSARLL